jgi:aminoglycoside phosphotransferase (APT) family kinase protein
MLSEREVERLGRWLEDSGYEELRGFELHQLRGGSQNDLYELRTPSARVVLRTPPATATAERSKTMQREFELLRALAQTDVPHARLIGGEETGDTLGRPFILMQLVDGWCPTTAGWPAPFATDADARRGLAFELVEGAARLARVDWQAVGLGNFGRPDGFHERQVGRWLSFLAEYQFRELPGLNEAANWLRLNQPKEWSPGILHGDYQFANVMFEHGAPARLAAIIDWEMATIGDPLLDLGWALIAWPPEGSDIELSGIIDLAEMPARHELVAHYEKVSGRTVEDIKYYSVLAHWKLGIVLEKSAARATQGLFVETSPIGPKVLGLIRKAAELTRLTMN